jgi:prophage regulatory protein
MWRYPQTGEHILNSGENMTETESEFVDSKQLEVLTGTKASTWRYWASLDPPEGPASFKLGRRRVWKRSVVLAWLAEQEKAEAR